MFKNILYALFVLASVVIVSCTEMDDNFKKYVENGEIEYSNKVDSIKAFNGYNRVKITASLFNAVTVKEVVVSWNGGADMLSFPYQKSENDIDALELLIPNLEEKSYQFSVYTVDNQGASSIKVDAFATAYGETYRSNLEAKSFKSTLATTDNLSIELSISSPLERNSEFKYFDKTSGEEIVITTMPSDENVVLNNVDFSKEIQHRTFYVPDAEAIDEFDSDWVMYTKPQNIIDLLSNATLTPILGGVNVSIPNATFTNLQLELTYMVGGVVNSTKVESSENPINVDFVGLDAGLQDVYLGLNDASQNQLVQLYTITTIGAPEIIDFCFEHPNVNNYAVNAFDGVLDTKMWFTGWQYPNHQTHHNNNSDSDIGHYIVMDYKIDYTMTSITVQTDAVAFLKTVDVWVSSDETYVQNTDRGSDDSQGIYWKVPSENNWTKIGTITFATRTANESKTLTLNAPTEFRLLKLTMPDSHNTANGNIRVSEITVEVE